MISFKDFGYPETHVKHSGTYYYNNNSNPITAICDTTVTNSTQQKTTIQASDLDTLILPLLSITLNKPNIIFTRSTAIHSFTKVSDWEMTTSAKSTIIIASYTLPTQSLLKPQLSSTDRWASLDEDEDDPINSTDPEGISLELDPPLNEFNSTFSNFINHVPEYGKGWVVGMVLKVRGSIHGVGVKAKGTVNVTLSDIGLVPESYFEKCIQ